MYGTYVIAICYVSSEKKDYVKACIDRQDNAQFTKRYLLFSEVVQMTYGMTRLDTDEMLVHKTCGFS